MKKSMKQWLSALLAIVMVAGMLMVPAGAAVPMGSGETAETPAAAAGAPDTVSGGHSGAVADTPADLTDATGTVGSEWTFTDVKYENPSTEAIDGLVFSGGVKKEANKSHLQGGAGGKVTIPVAGPCDVQVTYYYQANGTIGDVSFYTASNDTGTYETQSYTYTGSGNGTVDLTFLGSSYVTKIAIAASSNGTATVSSLKADKTALTVEVDAEGTINTALNGKAATIYAFSDSESNATVSVEGKAVKVTGKAEGSANVVIAASATPLNSIDEAKAVDDAMKVEIPVTVNAKPTGPVYVAEGTHSFNGDETNNTVPGITWGETIAHDNSHGPNNQAASGATATVKINLKQKANVTLRTCCYGTGCTIDEETIAGSADKEYTYNTGIDVTSEGGTVGERVNGTEIEGSNLSRAVITLKGATGELTFTFTGLVFIHSIDVSYIDDTGVDDGGKISVWDFGAQQLDAAKFNNKLTEDIINAWYPGVEPGTPNKNLASFDMEKGNGISFSDGGYSSTHRLRTKNTNLTHYDDKDLTAPQGMDPYFSDEAVTYNGYIYSNKSADATVSLGLRANKGDKLVLMVSSNGGDGTCVLEDAEGGKVEQEYSKDNKVQALTYWPAMTGAYKFYYTKEKMVVARIYREPGTAVTVSGTFTGATDTLAEGCQLVFTDLNNGSQEKVTPADGNYSVELFQGHKYTLSLAGDDKHVISSDRELDLSAETATEKTLNVTVEAVPMSKVTVTVSGVEESITSPATARIVFKPQGDDAIYEPPALNVANGDQTVDLEKNREYTVTLINADDYTVSAPAAAVKFEQDTGTQAVTLAAVPTYKVTIEPTGLTLADLADATFTFTRIADPYTDAKGKPAMYTYTFTGPDNIMLRDGQYKIVVDTTKGTQKLTPDVKVNGAAVTRTVAFETELPTSWVFTDSKYETPGEDPIDGLVFAGGVKKESGKSHLQGGAGSTIQVPVNGPCDVVVSIYYQANITVGDVTKVLQDGDKGYNSTSETYDVTYHYTGGAGTVTITFNDKCYVTAIKTVYAGGEQITQDFTVTVGKDGSKNYETIGAALAAVAAMDRASGVRATIAIDPGDYEEQLIVNIPNITLKNASDTPSIALTDKGVHIDPNAVRITWYYGHGYDYYSMTTGGVYDPEVMAVNQENGYLTFSNAGSNQGQTFWNSTVSILADGFQAEGIIFENSFNQYMSAKAKEDTIVSQGAAPAKDRENLEVGDTSVQGKSWVERAAALGINNGVGNTYFENCAFVGRQDVLFGGTGDKVALYKCDLLGSTDYIMGPMTAVFAKCNLLMNTGVEQSNTDVSYITAGQQTNGARGYLMYNCTIGSTTPNVNTAATLKSKPGTFGRAWSADCEVVWYETIVEGTTTTADGTQGDTEVSLIQPAGWTEGLGGKFDRCAEYHTHEVEGTVPNRLAPAAVLDTPVLKDGTPIDYETWLGDWKPFEGKDMTVDCPDAETPAATSITLKDGEADAEAAYTMKVGETKDLTVVVTPAEADQSFTVSGATEAVAATAGEGKITIAANAATEAPVTITVTATGTELTDTVAITVEKDGGGDQPEPSDPAKALADAITEAEKLAEDTQTSEDGTDVRKTEMWVTEDVMGAFQDAIDAAKTVAGTEGVTDAQLADALETLNGAVKTFTDARKEGTRRSSLATTTPSGSNTTTTVTETKPNANGDTVKSTTKPGGDKTITVTTKDGDVIAQVTLPATIPTPTAKFTDVPDSHWAAKAINEMAGLNMVQGVNEARDVFAPNDVMNRASVATMFYRLSNGQPGLENTFADVQGHWSADAVAWAALTGVVSGYPDGTFQPEATITRQQLAAMLQRYAELLAMDASAHASALDAFVDGDQAADWAVDGLAWCVKNGIMNGRGNGALDPTSNITRAEASAMFDRFIHLVK